MLPLILHGHGLVFTHQTSWKGAQKEMGLGAFVGCICIENSSRENSYVGNAYTTLVAWSTPSCHTSSVTPGFMNQGNRMHELGVGDVFPCRRPCSPATSRFTLASYEVHRASTRPRERSFSCVKRQYNERAGKGSHFVDAGRTARTSEVPRKKNRHCRCITSIFEFTVDMYHLLLSA